MTMVTKKSKKAWPWLWFSVLVILLDQLSKYLANHFLSLGHPVKILPFLNFTLNYNTGAAFSFLGTENGWQIIFFAAISFVVSIFLILWLSRTSRSEIMMLLGLSLIIGGALGNFIDRLRWSYVTDFIDFHIKDWHFATFNVADSAICVGVFLLIVHMLLTPSSKP
ncbi:signal peptidase II [Coxiella burnetii]|nr:signal peptidase II [Coxiella burnetii]NP_819436.2 lipoprotein signal peptidase [Coxiella burnetii RSA 493]AAO89950.2 lipoprotein signal peptidase [Coxiella burnetii RSA 493]ARI65283.1 signal peptidase II [Coxiella burnetii]ARK26767.1 signal peptidase II [Coxiella burnetii]MCF2094438.1 signal peptidase II [Coxiella burnetii]MCF2096368.1 signal peptidase II [Coxiella burnetii]